MGLVYQIRQKGHIYNFSLTNRYTGEESAVWVDPDKIRLYEEGNELPRPPEQCTFLRYDPETGKACCTIYLTRPEVCSEFYCSRLHIFAGGIKVGRVMGNRMLCSDDAWLRKLWDAQIANLHEPDESIWIDEAARLLMNTGYTVRK
jgi:hypothetical protein